jgi:quercetin dioxygenase-like cupin family protein
MKAFKLINTANDLSAFQEGTLPPLTQVEAGYFFAQTNIEEYQRHAHPAPRCQFVVTLKGKLRFTVSDGSSFIIEPGVILIAKDLAGEGHNWELIEGDEWHRIYIVMKPDAPDHFKIK